VAKVQQRLAGTPNETAAAPSAVQSNDAKTAETVPAVAYNPIREVMDADGRVYYISH
jgi:hypothetical protein